MAALLIICGCTKDAAKSDPPIAAKPAGARRIEMAVTTDGFVPSNVTLKANEPVTLVVTRKTDETCATEILIDGTDIKADLPLDKPVEVAWTPKTPGKIKFGCAMDKMIGGILLVE
ncbi:MAG: cupredoxin domain-containing protein [Archangium sp.]